MPYNGARKSETEKVWDRPIIGPKGTGRNAAYNAEKTIKDAVILVLSLDLVKSLNFEHTFQRWNFPSLPCNFLQSLIKFSIPTRSAKNKGELRGLHFISSLLQQFLGQTPGMLGIYQAHNFFPIKACSGIVVGKLFWGKHNQLVRVI